MLTVDILKIIVPTTLSFFVGIAITPFLTDFLYKHQMWKKKAKEVAVDGHGTPIFNKLHKDKETKTPRLGGVVIWASTFIVGGLLWILARTFDIGLFDKLEFVSRNQTWIPFWALLVGALVGLVDDLLEIKGTGKRLAGGLSLKMRLGIIGLIGLFVGTWFFTKLDVTAIGIPFYGPLEVGWLLIPIYMLVMMVIYAGLSLIHI